jgi:hypothetical protein
MPQLVKGGKNAFAWSRVAKTGRIRIPEDAFMEYGFRENEAVILMSGSNTSGGFALSRISRIQESPLSSILRAHPALTYQGIPAGRLLKFNSKFVCWALIVEKSITLPFATLQQFGIKRDALLLTVRGSNFGLGFIIKGSIIEEAKKHKELKIYE